MKKISYKKLVIPVIFLLFFTFYLLIDRFVEQDFITHASFARQMLTGERTNAGDFLFFWLVNIFSFFSTEVAPSEISLCFLIAAATTFRYYLSQKHIYNLFNEAYNNVRIYWISVFIALSLMFVFVIPIPSYFVHHGQFYFKNFVPNIWHNSTTIFLFPFALMLFGLSNEQLNAFNLKRNVWMFVLIFLNVFIKPSYFFVFACVFPIFLFIKYRLKKQFWYGMLPVVIGLLLLVLEYWIIYKTPNPADKEISSVVFHPFYFYTLRSALLFLPSSLFFSLLFPICYVFLNFTKLKKILLFWFTFSSFIVSVLIFLLIAESGPRAGGGNFYWQIVICTWLCFFISLASLIKDFNREGLTGKNKFLFSVYSLHVLMGLIYFVRFFVVGTFY
ncbi:MAG: hypothetical protein ABSF81_01265 [Bacteroidales bacterium]